MSKRGFSHFQPPIQMDRNVTSRDGNGNITLEGTQGPCTVLSTGWEFEGWDVPNFNKRVAAGELLPHTPFKRITYRDDQELAAMEYKRYALNGVLAYHVEPLIWQDGEASWQLTPEEYYITGDPEDWDYLVQQAAANIYSKGHDTLTFIAELGKTQRMLLGISKRLYDLTKGKSWKKVADLWLEGRYGWRTLIYDLQDLQEVIEEFDRTRSRYSERAGVSSSEITEASSNAYGDGFCTWNRDIVIETRISKRGAVTADIIPPRFGTNPITTTWELIPFSFVVDWLLTVGKSLEAMSFQFLASDHVASLGYKLTTTETWFEYDVEWFNAYGTFQRRSTSTRVVSERIPTTIPLSPQLNLRLDEWKVLDLLALTVQQLKRRN